MIIKNQPMLLASHLADADCLEELIAAPRPAAVSGARKTPRLAYVSLVGFMTPDYCDELSEQLASFAASDRCATIVLWINSGGGYYTGTPELAERVRRTAAIKPVIVIIVGYCCSGAYWVASQATTIYAAPSAIVGSINAYVVLLDSSEALKREGLKVLRIAGAGGVVKGHPTPGVEVPDEFIAMIQNSCDYIALKFIIAVQKGRKIGDKESRPLATGEVWHAEIARTSKLVDYVMLPEDAIASIVEGLAAPATKPPEQYARLVGIDAEEKLAELLQSRFGVDDDDDDDDATPDQLAALREEFPTLCQAAATNAEARRRRSWSGPGMA